jgi:hypothetical protein
VSKYRSLMQRHMKRSLAKKLDKLQPPRPHSLLEPRSKTANPECFTLEGEQTMIVYRVMSKPRIAKSR